jgi:hypothetical protein
MAHKSGRVLVQVGVIYLLTPIVILIPLLTPMPIQKSYILLSLTSGYLIFQLHSLGSAKSTAHMVYFQGEVSCVMVVVYMVQKCAI